MRKTKGFTLVELLAVIVILGLLIGIAIPVYFNITRTVKGNEYESKKKYIENVATNYAEDHNITTSLVFTPSRLIANGYMSADKYVTENGEEIPFVINPSDEKENLACRIINISINDYDYTAEMTDKSDCSLAAEEVVAVNMGIEAYRLDGNTIGNKIGIDGKTFDWVNSDVLLLINPKFNTDDIIISANGNSTVVDKSNMLSNPSPGRKLDKNYSNTVVIRAEKILKSEVSINIKAGDAIKTATVGVRIDKETPVVNSEKYDGWVGVKKTTVVYLSDGSGSGPAGVYVTKTNSFNSTNYFKVRNSATNTAEIGALKGVSGYENGLINGTIYLWPRDIAGNVSKVAFPVEIKNVDLNPPVIEKIAWNIDSDISCSNGTQCTNPNDRNCTCRKGGIDNEIAYDRARKVTLSIKDNESGLQKVDYCLTSGASCNPNRTVTSLNQNFTIEWTNSKVAQRICYTPVDNVGNKTLDKNGSVLCTNAFYVDGTPGSLDAYEYDNIRTVKLRVNDPESGTYKYKVEAVNSSDSSDKKYCESPIFGSEDYYNSSKFYDCLFRYLTAARNYNLTITIYNRANNPAIVTKLLSTNDYKVETGYILCNADNNWCTGDDFETGVFVKYGDIEFVLYKKEDGAVYGVASKQNAATSQVPLINADCCDRDKCHSDYITDTHISGIWGDNDWKYSVNHTLVNHFNTLPDSNRTSVALNKTWYVDKILGSNFNVDLQQYTTNRIKFNDITDDFSMHISNGYTYYFPNEDDVTCYMDNGSQINDDGEKGKLVATVGNGKRIAPGRYIYYCIRSKSNDEMELQAQQEFYIMMGRDYNPNNIFYPNDTAIYNSILNNIRANDRQIRRNIAIYATKHDYDDAWDGTINSLLTVKTVTDDIWYETRYNIIARYGALRYNEYNNLKNRKYFQIMNDGQSISTLLTTYVDTVVYGEDFRDNYDRAVGHDGTYSSISALVARPSGYYATTPMAHGTTSVAMVIPFNPSVPFTGGIGTEDNPFIISTTWR